MYDNLLDIDWRAVLDVIGSPAEIVKGINDKTLNPRTVRLWRHRNSVPGRYVLPVLCLWRDKQGHDFIDVSVIPENDPFKEPT